MLFLCVFFRVSLFRHLSRNARSMKEMLSSNFTFISPILTKSFHKSFKTEIFILNLGFAFFVYVCVHVYAYVCVRVCTCVHTDYSNSTRTTKTNNRVVSNHLLIKKFRYFYSIMPLPSRHRIPGNRFTWKGRTYCPLTWIIVHLPEDLSLSLQTGPSNLADCKRVCSK